ncbi:hypothetical protein Aeqsu_1691 [Aequorivita sublithincola DSM 14238]|uniref:DUF3108 domain-containing protein n=1 Tax=Aequorivita sublithincola (strain DSM 14238 / LMG 21431 / ACAM 643 / 9-3) TaxID=746697 RepID=I3YW04_AEQSU|nr:hypothetical protein [Aequorivita sublithincola]AFL81172.1 hypothetical protein Aeqsu_1691 [Aequorivita sublithincola DSM 14238]
MKSILIPIIVGLFSCCVSLGQNCTAIFFPSERGTKFQHSSYKADNTLESIVDLTVLSVNTIGGKKTIQCGLRGHIIGNNETYNTTVETVCDGDVTFTDPSQWIDPALLQQFYKEYNGRIIKKSIEIPYNLSVGDELPDYFLEVFGNVKGIELHFSSQTYGRSVIDEEQLETPAGTFNCYVLEFTTHTIVDVGAFGGTAETTTGKHWVAKGIGTVRSEEYRDGVLHHYTELTGFMR